jgi:hypothetical protein
VTSAPGRRLVWAAAAIAVSILPFARGLSGSRLFYIRDLSSYFWPRYLWLRRTWLAGEWPLWDPYVGAGQAAFSDALHQMFLPPAILARLVGNEVFGFNLWVALPFPLAALGAWLFFARRFSAPAAALAATAFAVSGPIVSTGNFPNLSWSVAALPWVLWATDRLVSAPDRRNVALVAVAVAAQCLAGEPVTLFSTLVLASAYAAAMAQPGGTPKLHDRLRSSMAVVAGGTLGVALAAIQVLPMIAAARLAERADTIAPDMWSLRPTALLETVWLHLFGDYYATQSLGDVPWMPLVYTSREPLLFSLYFGVPLLAIALFGLAGTGPRRWRLFWLGAGFLGLLFAFGSYTPLYPPLRDHVPPFGSFRFPVKYIVVTCMALAAGAAAGWDSLWIRPADAIDGDAVRRARRARRLAVGVASLLAGAIAVFAAACLYAPAWISGPLDVYARALGARTSAAAEFMVRTAPGGAVSIVAVAAATALLLGVATRERQTRLAAVSLWMLAALGAGDLVVRAAGINPVMDRAYLEEPVWVSYTRADPDARIYVGGKVDSTLSGMDIDGSRGYVNAPGLTGSASRASLNVQAAFYPSAWHVREMLSYDLPVIWPKWFSDATARFFEMGRDERDRLLERTGVRYRILPQRSAGARVPLVAIPQFYESFLFDYAGEAAPRVSVVPDVRLVPRVEDQVDALFRPGWDSRQLALVDRDLPAIGEPGPPRPPAATILEDRSNRLVIDAAAGSTGGYLVVLDSFSNDWHATVDGQPSIVARADGLFRAVRLPPGRHRIRFDYQPVTLSAGFVVTVIALSSVLWLLIVPGARRRQRFIGTGSDDVRAA